MRTRLSAIVLSGLFALSLVACDDIILPDDPLDPGNGGQDTSAIDTSGPHDRLVLTGSFVPLDPSDNTIPTGSKIAVLWHRSDGVDVAHGFGEITGGNTWRIEVQGDLPAEAYWGDPDGEHTFAVGTVSLVSAGVVPDVVISTGVFGNTAGFDIIYDSNVTTSDEWGKQFLDRFPQGYTLGVFDFTASGPLPRYLPAAPTPLALSFIPWN